VEERCQGTRTTRGPGRSHAWATSASATG
jgi:hypothetical protein